MNDAVGTVFGLTKDWTSLKRYGPPARKYKGRRKESDDGDETRQGSDASPREKTETKDEVKGFEITV